MSLRFEDAKQLTEQACAVCRSTLDGLMKITRTEGYRVLYRGMDLNLLVGVPMVSFCREGR